LELEKSNNNQKNEKLSRRGETPRLESFSSFSFFSVFSNPNGRRRDPNRDRDRSEAGATGPSATHH
jgi:hypothetical protein